MPNPDLIVLTNDDGFDAPGLAALGEAVSGWAAIRVFAPLAPHSGCSHVVTNHKPLVMSEPTGDITVVEGTPADCVRMALHRHGPGISWVFSGINAGGNLGADLHHSGTVAAVREGALRGIPGVAISHYIARGRSIDWVSATRWTSRLLRDLMKTPPPPGTFWNVNLPHPEPGCPDPSVVYCLVDPSPLPLGYREEPGGLVYSGDYQKRARVDSADVDVCFGGKIAVSLVRVMSSVSPSELPQV